MKLWPLKDDIMGTKIAKKKTLLITFRMLLLPFLKLSLSNFYTIFLNILCKPYNFVIFEFKKIRAKNVKIVAYFWP